MKTREEVEALKKCWKSDPCWDIYETDGFEDYKEELILYQLQVEDEEEKFQEYRITKASTSLGCTPQLLRYIETLEAKVSHLQDVVYKNDC